MLRLYENDDDFFDKNETLQSDVAPSSSGICDGNRFIVAPLVIFAPCLESGLREAWREWVRFFISCFDNSGK